MGRWKSSVKLFPVICSHIVKECWFSFMFLTDHNIFLIVLVGAGQTVTIFKFCILILFRRHNSDRKKKIIEENFIILIADLNIAEKLFQPVTR